jgi:hypothetical protein
LFRFPAAVKRSLDPEDTEDSAAKHGKGFAFAQASTNYNKNIYRKSETESTHTNPASRIREKSHGPIRVACGSRIPVRNIFFWFRKRRIKYSKPTFFSGVTLPTFYRSFHQSFFHRSDGTIFHTQLMIPFFLQNIEEQREKPNLKSSQVAKVL